jgi:hypothetical protein
MVDMWMLAVCVAAKMSLKPIDLSKLKTQKIIEGSIFSSDPWRVHALMLLIIGLTGDVEIVSEPRKIMNTLNGLAVAGLPHVIKMLKDGEQDPIYNLSDALEELVRVH